MTAVTVPRDPVGRSGIDPVRRYLDEIGLHPLLTPMGERALAERIAVGRQAEEALERVGRDADIDPAERRRLRRAVEDGRRAREQFVNANLRLVVSVAKKYQASGVPLLDLIQEGNLGLIRAVEKFDHTKGFRFSTYGVWWIRQFIARGIAGSRSTIKLPSRAHDDLLRLRELSSQTEQVLGRRPDLDELSELSGISRDRVADLLASVDPVSLSTPVGEDSSAELGDLVEDPRSVAEVESVATRLSSEEVDRALSVLDERERHILGLRFGFDGLEPRSVADVADVVGLSRERVRQLEHRAVAKLVHPSWRGLVRLTDRG